MTKSDCWISSIAFHFYNLKICIYLIAAITNWLQFFAALQNYLLLGEGVVLTGDSHLHPKIPPKCKSLGPPPVCLLSDFLNGGLSANSGTANVETCGTTRKLVVVKYAL